MSSAPTFTAPDAVADLEEGLEFAPKFDAQGLIPCVTTDASSGEVLMFAYMNAKALSETIRLGEAVYYSRSRAELWHKGATSGHVQKVVEMRVDCDQDCIWLRVDAQGKGACHVGYRSCFFRRVPVGPDAARALEQAEADKLFDPKAVYGKK